MEIQNTRAHTRSHKLICEQKNLQINKINPKIFLVQKIYSKGTRERKERSVWGEAVKKVLKDMEKGLNRHRQQSP